MKYFTMYGRMFGRSVLLATALVAVFVGTASAQKGSFTDSRDGQKYKTVKIGKQTWMAENLRYKTGVSKCYDDIESNCQKYGRMYDWNTAKVACPKGWRLPSNDEWIELLSIVDFGDYRSFGFVFEYPAPMWWTATEYGRGAYIRCMNFESGIVDEDTAKKSLNLLVRCVADD